LVGYPILDLDRFFTDLGRYLRTLEEAVIRTCADYGLDASRVDGRTGAWIGPDEDRSERKVCAMGVRCSRWVTMHGFAFNLNTDLDYFNHIVPCGIADRGVTSLANELNRLIDEAEATAHVVHHLAALLDVDLTVLQGHDARAFLHDVTGETLPDPVPASSS
jgi:lipoyl(octanoyl) transferase